MSLALPQVPALGVHHVITRPFAVDPGRPPPSCILPADGYGLILISNSQAVSEAIYPKLSYDLRQDFMPINVTADSPMVIAVNPGIGVKTMPERVAYARKNPRIALMDAAIREEIARPEVGEKLSAAGIEVEVADAAALDRLLRGDIAQFTEVVTAGNIRPE